MTEKIAVIGLGYVGLPVALAFARQCEGVVGFDVNAARIAALAVGHDSTGEADSDALRDARLKFTHNPDDLAACTAFIVAVPTPIDESRQPDLDLVIAASRTVGRVLRKGAVVIYESTVYPGVTEDICGPVLEEESGLVCGRDFTLGYSPERINPGDKEHTLERITKVVSGQDPETLERVAALYATVVTAGVHKAPSIKVAEAAKVIENTQRDLNIALMNELAIIFDKMGIRTADVLAAARTKWNFMPFTPGLVGGHCIGVDPYYLTAKAELLGYHPQVILAGRRINDGMGVFIAQKIIKLLVQAGKPVRSARVGILGLTFKENVPDLRNSRVPDIVVELRDFGIDAMIHDPLAEAEGVHEEYGLTLSSLEDFKTLDVLVMAVPHRQYLEMDAAELRSMVSDNAVIVDIKSALPAASFKGCHYWSL